MLGEWRWLLAKVPVLWMVACYHREREKFMYKEPVVVISALFACQHQECEKCMRKCILSLKQWPTVSKNLKELLPPFQEANSGLKPSLDVS